MRVKGIPAREFARQLRKGQTDAERRLWRALRNRSLCGYKFRRQHPVGPYTLDFYCFERGLAIEIDGGQHARQIGKDAGRTKFLFQKGIRVLRFWDNEVLQSLDCVLNAVLSALNDPHPDPLPKGEGEQEAENDPLEKEKTLK